MSLIGLTLSDGRYRIDGRLGAGGMGVVYAAYDTKLQVKVAIKLLAPELADKRELHARLRQEGFIQARLKHSSICHVFDLFEDDDHLGLVMQHLDGHTLAERVRQEGAVDLVTVWRWMMPVLEAIHLAHQHGIVHRDLKANNVMLVQEGSREVPKVLDFGIAKILDESRTAITGMSSPILGTPQFMAPEQITGGPVDARTDIHALGVLIYYLAAGELPYRGDSVEVRRQKREGISPPAPSTHVPTLPILFDECIQVAMAAEPAGRFRSVEAFARALDRAVKEILPEGEVLDTGPFRKIRESNTSLPVTEVVSRRSQKVAALGATEHSPRGGGAALGPTEHDRAIEPTPLEPDPGPAAPALAEPPGPERARRRRPRIVGLAALLILLVGAALTANGLQLWRPACDADPPCGDGAVCHEGRCWPEAESGVEFYRGVIEAYNERDRAAYFDAWRYPVGCFWRPTQRSGAPWTRAVIEEMRRTQFDEGGRAVEIERLDAAPDAHGRLVLTEHSLHHKPESTTPVERQIVLERQPQGWRIAAEAATGAPCLTP